jgi:hypothetical protein
VKLIHDAAVRCAPFNASYEAIFFLNFASLSPFHEHSPRPNMRTNDSFIGIWTTRRYQEVYTLGLASGGAFD